MTLKPLFVALWLGTALIAGPAAGYRPPPNTSAEQHTPCCGTITPEGLRLAAVIDSMHVEEKWQAKEHINWETGEPDRPADYAGPGKATHCSAFAAALGERLNVYLLRPPQHSQILLASAQAEWFRDPDGVEKGWKSLAGPDREQMAQERANRGFLVMIVYESPNPHTPGHIVVVRPSDKSPERLRKEGPQIAQAGTINYSSHAASLAFVHHPGAWPEGVHYYWHRVEWAAIAGQ